MTKDRTYHGLLAVLALGVVVAFGSLALTSWQLVVASAVGGTALIFASLAAIYFVIDEEIRFSRLLGEPKYDERTKRIEARAARNAYAVLLALMTALILISTSLPQELPADLLLIGLTFVSLFTLGVSTKVYRQRM